MGVLLKNEVKHSDMVSILEHTHKYIPTVTTEEVIECDDSDGEEIITKNDRFHHILYGGDQLTTEQMRGAKNVRSNACRGKERLEGVVPMVEDWHTKVLLKVSTVHVHALLCYNIIIYL